MADYLSVNKEPRELTSQAFALLLHRLDADPDCAGQRYERLHRKLSLWFERRGCACPAELADRTLDRVAQRLADGVKIQAEDLSVYALGVAAKVLLEYLRSPENRQVSLASEPSATLVTASYTVKQSEQEEERLACLKRCLDRLPPADRVLIQTYYHDDWQTQVAQRRALAEQLGLADSSLRARAHRIRHTLESCLQRCLKGGAKK